MRKIISILLTVFLLAAPLSLFANAAQTTDEIAPKYNNVISTRTTATVSPDGILNATVKFTGINGITTRAIITTYVERRILGIFWSRVDIGNTNDEWIDTVYNYKYEKNHSTQLDNTGTYRVTATYQIYGSGGAADEVIEEITVVY